MTAHYESLTAGGKQFVPYQLLLPLRYTTLRQLFPLCFERHLKLIQIDTCTHCTVWRLLCAGRVASCSKRKLGQQALTVILSTLHQLVLGRQAPMYCAGQFCQATQLC